MEEYNLTCIRCPMGCALRVSVAGDEVTVTALIDIPGETMVQRVVGRSDVIEHLLHLLGFSPFVVGFYRLLLVHTS